MEIANPVVDSVVNSVVDRVSYSVVSNSDVIDRFVDNGLVVGHSVVDSVRSDVNSDLNACDVSVATDVASLLNNVEVDDTIEEVENGHILDGSHDLDGVVASVVSAVVTNVVGVPRRKGVILEKFLIW